MKVKLLKPLSFFDGVKLAGEVVDLPEGCAAGHIADGRAVAYEEETIETETPIPEAAPVAEEPAIEVPEEKKSEKRRGAKKK